ncbi:MAG: hypothetical protein GY940_08675, partial [bacterium]|nr:hypothetical protein [bacterium]
MKRDKHKVAWDYDTLTKKYGDLEEPHRKILQLCSIVYEPVFQRDLLAAAQQCGIKAPQGRNLTAVSLKMILNQLVRGGFLVINGQRYGCREILTEDLTWNATRENNLEQFVNTLQKQRSFTIYRGFHSVENSYFYRFAGFEKCMRELRIRVYSEDFEEVHKLVKVLEENYPDEYNLFNAWDRLFNAPFNPERFRQVPLKVQAPLMRDITPACILDLRASNEITDFLEEYCKNGTASFPDDHCKHFFLNYRLTLLLSRGNLKEAGRLAAPDPGVPVSYFLSAWREFLSGNNETAIKTYRQGLKRYRKLGRNRHSYHPHLSNLFYILMLINTGDRSHHETISAIVNQSFKEHCPYRSVYAAFAAYLAVKENRIKDAEEFFTSFGKQKLDSLTLLTVALGLAWFFPDKLVKLKRQLKTSLQCARENGYPWFALQYAALLARCVDSPRPYEELAAQLEESLGLSSLLPLVADEAPWERTLNAIADFCSPEGKGGGSETSTRLVWSLQMDGSYITISPKLQTRKSTGWTRGRGVALKRLKSGEISCMTPHDHKISDAVLDEYGGHYYNSASYYIDVRKAMP